MTDPDAYVRNLKEIGDSIKRHNSQLKTLKEKKKAAERRLHAYMTRNNLIEYGGFKATTLAPKEKKPIKKKAEKKADAVRLFAETGITDPEGFWEAFQNTQKVALEQEQDDIF
jgi:hypothetical protein